MDDLQLSSNDMCFACGKHNPIGLKLEFATDGEEHVGEFVVGENFQGFTGIAHGGILSTVLDEVMARMLLDKGYNAITARLEVRFRRPVKTGEKLLLRASFLAVRGRRLETEARALNEAGEIMAEAKATSICV